MRVSLWVLILCVTSIVGACQKVELPTQDDVKGEQSGADTGSSGENSGGTTATVNTVSQLLEAYPNLTNEDEYETRVVGYIVGFCDGTSISHAKFTAEEARASNLLIADSRHETNVERCMPVELKSGTDVRSELNLETHPENLGKKVWLYGMVKRYFSVTGLKNVEAYKWIEEGDSEEHPEDETPDGPEVPDEPEQPAEPDEPAEPEQPQEPSDPDVPVEPEQPDVPVEPEDDGRDTITVEHEPTVVPGGRNV